MVTIGGIITPPEANTGSATNAAILSAPISKFYFRVHLLFSHQSSIVSFSSLRFGLTSDKNVILLDIVSSFVSFFARDTSR